MSDQLAPSCPRCRKRHLLDLPCWAGRYAQRCTATVLATQGRVCWICGGAATTADHVIARAYGGTDVLENLRPACQPCNSRRGKDPNPFDPDPEPRPTGVGLSPRWRTA